MDRLEDSDNEKIKSIKKSRKKANNPLKNDPNAPKKPILQGYLLYFSEVRPIRQKDYPNLTNQDLTKLIADEWNNLGRDRKDVTYYLYKLFT